MTGCSVLGRRQSVVTVADGNFMLRGVSGSMSQLDGSLLGCRWGRFKGQLLSEHSRTADTGVMLDLKA